MNRAGYTHTGRQRYWCATCRTRRSVSRPDLARRNERARFVAWITGVRSLADLASEGGVSRWTLSRRFVPFFAEEAIPEIPGTIRILIVDGTYAHGTDLCVLVGVTENRHVVWRFAKRETSASWSAFLRSLPRPDVVVCDGQKGLLRAICTTWPGIRIQRCQFHVILLATTYLTRKPKTEAGRALLSLLYRLKDTKDAEARDRWTLHFHTWERRHAASLRRGGAAGKNKLASARYLVRHALPHLFTFLDVPDCPNTTNLVEGWVNARLAEAMRRHRGLPLSHQKALVTVLLAYLAREKTTRKLT